MLGQLWDAAARSTGAEHEDGGLLLVRRGVAGDGALDILKAAADLFNEKGYSSTSIDDIADRLGATKGRVYHYYRSKADLFLDLQAWALEQCLTMIRPLAEREDLTPEQAIYAMAHAHVVLMGSGLGFQLSALMGREATLLNVTGERQQAAMRYVVRLRDVYEDMFAEVIARGIEAGCFVRNRPRLLTKPFFGALNWMLVWYQSGQGSSSGDLEEIADALASFVVGGLKASGRPNLPLDVWSAS